ncbi:hypothetical protein [Phreatobacter sp.]|uniref:hypothetical protein n=1 Tax=Phreatobacter sp. TaxID=1966341 RepID=UPI003F70C1EE
MRSIVTFAAALLLSLLAGGVALQIIVERVRADESFILAFFALPVLAVAFLVVLGLALGLVRTRRGVDVTAAGLGLFLVVAGLSLAVLEWLSAPTAGIGSRGAVLIGAIAAGSLVAVAVQWLMLRRLAAQPAAGEG